MITQFVKEETFEPFYKIEFEWGASLIEDIQWSYMFSGNLISSAEAKKQMIEIILFEIKSELEKSFLSDHSKSETVGC